MNQPTARMTIELPTTVKDRLEELAKTTDRPASGLAAEAISSFVEIQEWQIREIEKGLREADAGDFAGDEEVAAVFSKWMNAR
ncbi:MAG TPA: hypothetical protein VLE27_02785 [Thermoanaerobaculia bacterium]|nr:hypothetical protein [Thermoanaerobaculia bacterium]